MSEAATLFSLPGEWIDRRGRPRARFPIRRILVLKPDHIGDLLMTDLAMALLRTFFPEARMELVCGTWNVGLAKRLGRFDAVHGIDLFHEISGQQSNAAVAAKARRDGADALATLMLGPFDLAVDLRYDQDSRPFLRHIDARVYAGFGQSGAFPFLDITVPRHEGVAAKGVSKISLSGRDFSAKSAAGELVEIASTQGRFSTRRVALAFEIEGANSPRECGISLDPRVLGVRLEAVAVQPLASPDAEPEEALSWPLNPVLEAGWHATERAGTWSKETRAVATVSLPERLVTPFARVELRMRGFVSVKNPEIRCQVRAGLDGQYSLQYFRPPQKTHSIHLTIPTRVQPLLASQPFLLAPGRYDGTVALHLSRPPGRTAHIRLTLRGISGNAPLMERAFCVDAASSGLVTFAFSCIVESSGEPLAVELDTEDAELLDDTSIEHVSLAIAEPFRIATPPGHMSEWASLLVLRIAQAFSTEPPFGPSAPHLTTGRALPSAPPSELAPGPLRAACERLERWRNSGLILIGFALGCNTAIRKWPFEYFVELAAGLLRLGPVKIVFVGGRADQEEATSACVRLGLDPAEHSLCGAAALEDLGLLLGKLDLFIGNNSGATHFAGKTGVRTIGIYAGTNHPRTWGPIGDNASWIYRDEPCAPCHLSDLAKCTHQHACIRDILPAQVLALAAPELRSVVSRRSNRPAHPDPTTPELHYEGERTSAA